ncbi:hypothetical protein Tco_1084723, partial [Tanacetum coccineum]
AFFVEEIDWDSMLLSSLTESIIFCFGSGTSFIEIRLNE